MMISRVEADILTAFFLALWTSKHTNLSTFSIYGRQQLGWKIASLMRYWMRTVSLTKVDALIRLRKTIDKTVDQNIIKGIGRRLQVVSHLKKLEPKKN